MKRLMTKTRTAPLLAAVLVAAAVAEAGPTLQVDVNGGDGPTLAGWTGFDPTGPTTLTDALGAGRHVTVQIGQAGALRDKDRGAAITGTYAALSDMLRDYYGSRANGDVVTLTLTLDPGRYDFTSYHHDGEANSTNTQEVEITRVGSGVVQTSVIESSTAPTSIVTFDSAFRVQTIAQVQFQIQKTNLASNNGEFGFNGFELELTDPGFAVDFGLAGHDVQNTFNNFANSNPGVNGPVDQDFASDYGVSGTVNVQVDSEGSGPTLDFRDRGDVTGADYADLVEDQIKNQQGGIELTLGDLAAGNYKLTSWHHDAGGGAAGNLIDILVSDALGSDRLVAEDLAITGGSEPAAIRQATYTIVSDGINPVTILFDNVGLGGDDPDEIALNGFQLLAIPEPAAGLMLAVSLLTLRRR